ncbi:MAG: hypothetical protein IJ593_06225 [Lachnospiraceae bacterium]|nr:hypothetical protein [Lachnospiraceae bacterium]
MAVYNYNVYIPDSGKNFKQDANSPQEAAIKFIAKTLKVSASNVQIKKVDSLRAALDSRYKVFIVTGTDGELNTYVLGNYERLMADRNIAEARKSGKVSGNDWLDTFFAGYGRYIDRVNKTQNGYELRTASRGGSDYDDSWAIIARQPGFIAIRLYNGYNTFDEQVKNGDTARLRDLLKRCNVMVNG